MQTARQPLRVATIAMTVTCASLAAQTPPPGQSPSPGVYPPVAATAGRVVATGCLERRAATPAVGTTPGTDSARPAEGESGYVLTHAQVVTTPDTSSSAADASTNPSASPPAAAQPGRSSDTAPGRPGGRQLPLAAGNGVDLAPHVGHQVSATGQLVGGTATAASPPRPGTAAESEPAGGSPGVARSSASPPPGRTGELLIVSALTMISATCGPQE